MATTTDFESKCDILGDVYVNYKNDPEFEDFFQYNDLGLPLAYCVAVDLVKPSDRAVKMIDETFELLLTGFGIQDTGFESLDDILFASSGEPTE